MKISIRNCLIGALAFLAPSSQAARGQGASPVIEEMRVDLWPEYDRPSTLVMYRFRLTAGADLSVPVTVPTPASAGEPHAVAWRNSQNSLFVADYTRRVEGDRAMVSARLGSTDGQLEFYSTLVIEGRMRTFRFEWPGGVEVGVLSFQVQQPTGSSLFHVTPAPVRQWVGEDGFTYVRVDLGRQDPSSTPAIEVTYERDTNTLSAAENPPARSAEIPRSSSQPAPPGTAPVASSSSSVSSASWLYALGGLLMGAGASWLVWSSRAPKSSSAGPEQQGKGSAKTPAAIYCHQCGTKQDPSATFCTQCGTRLLKRPQ